MMLKYGTVSRIIFSYRFFFFFCILWLITNLLFFYKLMFLTTNILNEENLTGLNKNESELLEKLGKKLRNLEKMGFIVGREYNQSKNYKDPSSKRKKIHRNNFLIIKDRKNKNEIFADYKKYKFTSTNSLHINNNSNIAKKEILIDTDEIQVKYNMTLLEDVKEEYYPGKYGKPVTIDVNELTASQKEQYHLGWTLNEFNQYVSDMIPLNRDVGVVREPGCDQVIYPSTLPSTSVIICFHNEAWSTLLRTVHSVLRHTPLELLSAIILVDDGSTFEFLKRPMEDYISQLPKVRIIRTGKREGLIRSRLIGFEEARSEIVTFLDSHCECAADWLRPMLARLQENPHSVVVPVIDDINYTTFAYSSSLGDDVHIGGFSWDMYFIWLTLPQRIKETRKSNLDPIMTPTIAGGLLSVRKDFFQTLGTYDPGFDTWGGENLELSFKTWMCGGRMEIITCSHVGHVFRQKSPYKWPKGFEVIWKNNRRLVEVWMDNYKNIYYNHVWWNMVNYGDVSKRKELRKNLKCKTFNWYLQNIIPELLWINTTVSDGLVMNLNSKKCLLIRYEKLIQTTQCNKYDLYQHIYYTRDFELRKDTGCITATNDIMVKECNGLKSNQYWALLPNKMIYNNASQRCLEQYNDDILLKPCSLKPEQIWNILKIKPA